MMLYKLISPSMVKATIQLPASKSISNRALIINENLQFRFCSKCEGNYEYCQDHLFTHQHIRRV